MAVWGDSMVPPVAANLGVMVSSRTVYDGAGIGDSSYDVVARQAADGTAHSNWISVFWYGHNNVNDPARIKSDLAASIRLLSPGNNRFIILSLVNAARPAGIKGGSEYAIIVQLNSELAALYPGNYIDVRTPLVEAYNPSLAQDVIDHDNDVPPTSIRFDEIHLRNEGSVLVAGMVRDFIAAKGW